MKLKGPLMGLHLTARGFGWVVFENANMPLDWGTAEIKSGNKNATTRARFDALLARYRPTLLVLEDSAADGSKRKDRIQRLSASIGKAARRKGTVVEVYSRGDIRAALGQEPDATRYETAQLIADRMHVLAPRLPAKRRIWESEHPNLSLFTAAASALAWFDQNS